jgi:hypothetical protein
MRAQPSGMSIHLITRPIPFAGGRLARAMHRGYSGARASLGIARRLAKPPHRFERFPGHPAVTGTLTSGLRSGGHHVRINTVGFGGTATAVGILANPDALASALEAGMRDLVVGPNVSVLPSEYPDLFEDPGVRVILVPSEWVGRLWARDMPQIAHKLSIWAAGVDYEFWQPDSAAGTGRRTTRHCLIYRKNPTAPALEAGMLAERIGYEWEAIDYGHYRRRDYRKLLAGTDALIYLGESESQGLALHEAWASDVPTFVFQPKLATINFGHQAMILQADEFSPSPYLGAQQGAVWSTMADLQVLLADRHPDTYSPRAATQERFGLVAAAHRYLSNFTCR